MIPSLLVAPFAGVWADRCAGGIRVWHVVALSLFLGIVNASDIPARQSFLVEVVGGREDGALAFARALHAVRAQVRPVHARLGVPPSVP